MIISILLPDERGFTLDVPTLPREDETVTIAGLGHGRVKAVHWTVRVSDSPMPSLTLHGITVELSHWKQQEM